MGSSLGKWYMSYTWERPSSYRETSSRQALEAVSVRPRETLCGEKHVSDMGLIC